MIKLDIRIAMVLLLSMACSQAYATHYQYVSLADISGVSIEQGDTWSWTFDLVNDDMYLWELTSPTSTPGGPTPDINTADSMGSYDPASALHYTYLRIDPNKVGGVKTSNFIAVSINDIIVADWSNPIQIYDWGVPGDPVSDIYGIANNNFSFTIKLIGLGTLGSNSIPITNINIEGCFDKNTPVPVPAAIWLFGSGLLGYLGMAKRRRKHLT